MAAGPRDVRVRPLFPRGPGAGVAQSLPGGRGLRPVPRRLFAGRAGVAPDDEPDEQRPEEVRDGVRLTGADTPTLVPRAAGAPPEGRGAGAASALPPSLALREREREEGAAGSTSERAEHADQQAQTAALDQAQAELAQVQRTLASVQEEAQAEGERYRKSLAEIDRLQTEGQAHLENELVDLAIEISRQILLREIHTDRQHVVRLVEAALRVVVEDENTTVLVAPQDVSVLEAERQRLEVSRGGGLIRITADPDLHPGDCVVQVGRARVDGRLMDRLERIRQVLHGTATETA